MSKQFNRDEGDERDVSLQKKPFDLGVKNRKARALLDFALSS